MTRLLSDLPMSQPDDETTSHDLRLTRRTGRSFAAAVAVLLLATVVVNRSGAALSGGEADSVSALTSGTIEIGDDDEGRALFDLRDLIPARPVTRCVEIAYTGTILPVTLSVRAEAVGSLAEYLDVTIESGRGGGFESCDGFEPTEVLADGSLDQIVGLDWIAVGDLVNVGETRSFRIEVSVQDRQEALGQETSMELAWEVAPS